MLPGDRWLADETSVKVAGRWTYLYQAIGQHGLRGPEGERYLRSILAAYEARYNRRRPHRSRQLHLPRPHHPPPTSPVSRSSAGPSLGGIINQYQRAA
jgi:DDE domain